jgi:phi13 family phage major tail protein
MAKIGLKNFRYAILTENQNGTHTYGGAKIPGKAISCSVSITSNSAKLRADDEDAEVCTDFSGGSVSVGIDRDDLQTQADLLGHTLTNGNLVRNANDAAPYVGFGRVITLLRDGVKKYKTEILYKVKFAEPNQEEQTKQESVSFNTSTLEGQIGTLANGDWSDAQIWDDFDDAMEHITDTFAAPASSGTGT